MTQELADNVKRLRGSVAFWINAKGISDYTSKAGLADDALDAIQTINQLVQLVGELVKGGKTINAPDYDNAWAEFDEALTKSAPIAKLAEELK